jgi:ketosteroid isomerase-like protein
VQREFRRPPLVNALSIGHNIGVMIFLESPWPIVVIGVAAEAILAVMLVRTGRGVLLGAMAAVGVAVGIGLLVERLVVTDRKLVARTIDGAAAALEANDLARLLELIAPDAAQTRDAATLALQEGEFRRVRLYQLEITVVRTTSPPTAKATFNVIATGKDRRGEFGELTRPLRMTVRLRRESGRWLITGHELAEDPHNT